jgi:predicted ATPase
MNYRIGIAGCAGTGKSALARAIAEKLGIPLLESKEITRDILERDGYDYSSGTQVERFLASTGRQNEILRRTLEQQAVDEFVTDRTVVDLAAYVVCEMHDNDTEVLGHILETCRKHAEEYTHIFLCPWEDKVADENQRRTLNPWYQFLIHTIVKGILDEWGCSFHILDSEDDRPEQVERVLSLQ